MKPRKLMKVKTTLSLILLGSSLVLGSNAYAKGGVAPVSAPVAVGGGGGGGTVKPPAKNLVAPVFVPTLADPLAVGTPLGLRQTAFTVAPGAINGAGVHGFDATGIIQNAKVDTNSDVGPGITPGCSGSVTVDNKNIIIPCGLIVQMPANTLTWAAFVNGGVKPLLDPSPAGAPFTVPPGAINGAGVHGFDATGIIQNATLDSNLCSSGSGSVTIDSKVITIPCGLIVQMPANTLTWKEFVARPLPALEITLVGNKVGGTYIAALAFVSQELLHSLSGTITSIDYSTGELIVDGITRVQINDPFGRFGRAQSPDARFSVDDQNPTIHAGTGYPMCVPRSGPDKQVIAVGGIVTFVKHPLNGLTAYPTINGIPQDPLCPQNNRPLAVPAGVSCRSFADTGFSPPVSGPLSAPAPGQTYCSQYVMRALPGAIVYPTGRPIADTALLQLVRSGNDADPSQQAPFEVGDFITYSGTVMVTTPTTPTSTVGTFISAHTIEANVGIFTQPGTQPAYVAIGGFGIGTADPTPAAVTGVAQESTNRLSLEAATTDFMTPIDIYLVDEANGGVLSGIINRWVTPWEMTGECPPGIGGTAPLAAACNGVTGGISTSLTGPQAQRDRIRAVKAPLGLLNRPSRTVRVVQRSLCTPKADANGFGSIEACLATASKVANGLVAGQYLAPNFEFIFPENVKQGDIPIPYDIWHLPFIRFGEINGTPALTPQPW